jgi:isopentenyl-diphosphate delta-isomerase type 1
MPLDNPNEQLYWVDTDDTVLGSITRQEAHTDKTKIHRSVQIVVMNDQHQVLLQKRSLRKDKYPGYWTVSASGHVEYGSTYEQTAAKELKQEVGLVVPLTMRDQFIVHMPTETEMIAVFSGTASAASTFLVDPIEVDQVKWLKMTDLSSFSRHHKFTLPALQTLRAVGYLKE